MCEPMSPNSHLAAVNFVLGDVQSGLGPFLAAWLAQTDQGSPSRVGTVTAAMALAIVLWLEVTRTMGTPYPAGDTHIAAAR